MKNTIGSDRDKNVKILSLSGGGYLGLYTACILEHFEQNFNIQIRDHFDLIAGTSVGGIIALALASGTSARDIRKLIEASSPLIFPKQNRGAFSNVVLKIFKFLNRPKYLYEFLLQNSAYPSPLNGPIFKQEPLRRAIGQLISPTKTLGCLETNVMISAINMTAGTPYFFTNHHTNHEDQDISLVDIALATSSCPSNKGKPVR